MTTESYTVTGLTCDHCVRAVSAEVGAIDGVTGVDVDLASGRVTVTADREIETERVRDAVEEAGYALSA
jgi:copper ion binding protein